MKTIKLKIIDPSVNFMTAPDDMIVNFLDDPYYYNIIIELEHITDNRYRCTTTEIDPSYRDIEYLLLDGQVYTEPTVQNRTELEKLDFFTPAGIIV